MMKQQIFITLEFFMVIGSQTDIKKYLRECSKSLKSLKRD